MSVPPESIVREDSIHRGQLLAQLPKLVIAQIADPAGLDRILDDVAAITGVSTMSEEPTPGPFHVCRPQSCDGFTVWTDRGGDLDELVAEFQELGDVQLFLAGHDLVAACNKAIAALTMPSMGLGDEALIELAKAVAKATGGSQSPRPSGPRSGRSRGE